MVAYLDYVPITGPGEGILQQARKAMDQLKTVMRLDIEKSSTTASATIAVDGISVLEAHTGPAEY